MGLIKKLFGWFFTYPAYRHISAEQSEGIVATLALALYADGEPDPREREELERELTGVPQFWADEAELRHVMDHYVERLAHEDLDALVGEVALRLDGLSPKHLLIGAALICNSDEDLTTMEVAYLTKLGRALGLDEKLIDRIVRDPEGESDAMFNLA